MQFVVFELRGQRFALPLGAVDRIVRAVEILPLPGAPGPVLGAINVGGSIVPVYCACGWFGPRQREIHPDQQLLLVRSSSSAVAMVIDQAVGVIEFSGDEITPSNTIAQGLERFQGVAKVEGGMVLIHDLEKFLSAPEAAQLAQALEHAA
jgi:purine-binding chemotaxis protein CheW